MKAIALFGKMLAFSRLRININNIDDIRAEIEQTLKSNASPIPVVIDSAVVLDLQALVEMLWSLNIQPIGVMAGELTEQATALRLAIFPADGQRIESLQIQKNIDENLPVATAEPSVVTEKTPRGSVQNFGNELELGLTSSVCDSMLRSGQSLQHLGGDLVVLGGVNRGADAITDSNLHVYGRGLGRLVAGATGDKDARIFCQRFDPSLVSVAGTYCLHDDIPKEMIDKAVQVSYDEQKGLVFTLMNS